MSRLNLNIEPELREILERVAKIEGISLTKLINNRLESSLTLEDRLGPSPPMLPDGWIDNVEFKLLSPEPLATYERIIETLDRAKMEVQKLYDDEVNMMMASDI